MVVNKHIKMARSQMRVFLANLNGLNGPVKRRQTLLQLKKLKLDVICLQETHMKKADE